jgi:hypothetical protein
MKMKKTVFCFVLIAGFVMSLSSCLFLIPKTFKMTVDDNVSEDQNVKITFVNGGNGLFIVKEWNGKKIVDALYGDKGIGGSDKSILTVPAGDNSFTFDLYFTFSNQYRSTTYSFKDIELRYNLESGNEYQVKGKAKIISLLKGYEFYVEIYNKTSDTLLKDWKLG